MGISDGSLTLVPVETVTEDAPSLVAYPSPGFFPGRGLSLVPITPS